MANDVKGSESTTKGSITPSKQKIYTEIASHKDEIFAVLYNSMKSKNENIALGAAKILVNKLIADLRNTELTGKDGEPVQFGYIKDFISPGGWNVPASIGGIEGPNEVQSNSMAPQSEENHNGSGKDKSGSSSSTK